MVSSAYVMIISSVDSSSDEEPEFFMDAEFSVDAEFFVVSVFSVDSMFTADSDFSVDSESPTVVTASVRLSTGCAIAEETFFETTSTTFTAVKEGSSVSVFSC